MANNKPIIAYLSMEFALQDEIPNYAGGLGVLAADLMMSSADLNVPAVGVSLLYHQDDDRKKAFPAEKYMQKCEQTVNVRIENRQVKLAIWKKEVKSASGSVIPIYFLSSCLEENQKWDRDLTKNLYVGHAYTRLGQEVILGIGAVKALRKLGYKVRHYHLNEGHCAPAILKRLLELKGDEEAVRREFSFTTHTPVSSGHDYFDYSLARNMVNHYLPENIERYSPGPSLGMTELALALSGSANSVSLRHKETCAQMFPGQTFENITNGVYHPRWIGEHMKKVLDDNVSNWQQHPDTLDRSVHEIQNSDLTSAKSKEKNDFIDWLNSHKEFFAVSDPTKSDRLDPDILTIGFARRMVPYKRASLIFHDINRLRDIGKNKIQLIFAGNIYSGDSYSSEVINLIRQASEQLRDEIKIVFIPEYNLRVAKRLVAGCDIWLNNPVPGREASGTSGMKAALNGGLNLSIMDGWWIEAFQSDAKSGWAFGEFQDKPDRDDSDFGQLMHTLADAIDCYYNRPEEWAERMKHAIGLASFFNTHRAVREYEGKMWNY